MKPKLLNARVRQIVSWFIYRRFLDCLRSVPSHVLHFESWPIYRLSQMRFLVAMLCASKKIPRRLKSVHC
jgi:hypothetical protein